MSIYSGFATRQLQQTYDECLEIILYLFQKRLLKFYKGQSTNQQKFYNILSKTYEKMKNMENHKYLQPKSSRTIQQFVTYLGQRQANQEFQEIGNKILQVQQIKQSDSYKKTPKVQLKKPQPQIKSHRLQSQENSHRDQQRSDQLRLNTTTNRIRRRTPHKSNNQMAIIKRTNIVSARLNKIQNSPRYYQNFSHEKQQSFIDKIQLNKILNQPDSKFIKISRNQPRTYFNTSHQQLRRNIIKSREKYFQQQNIEVTNSTQKDKDEDVKKLIKGYINKTKKNYLKSFSKRKSEIQDMLKCM